MKHERYNYILIIIPKINRPTRKDHLDVLNILQKWDISGSNALRGIPWKTYIHLNVRFSLTIIRQFLYTVIYNHDWYYVLTKYHWSCAQSLYNHSRPNENARCETRTHHYLRADPQTPLTEFYHHSKKYSLIRKEFYIQLRFTNRS